MLPPWDASTEPDTLTVLAHNGKIYANGERLDIKGVNWFGSEGRSGPPLGLDKHKIAWYMDFLRQHKFNAIRFLFNHKTILDDETLEPPNEEVYGKGAAWEAPELENYKYLDMFHKLAEVASEHGILVMMAAHRLSPSAWPGDGLWYDATVSEQGVKESWSKIADKLCGQWNVFAVDLQNEPHASSWGKGGTKDWGHAAERLGNHVLSSCPRWLIMVEGVGYDPGAPGMDNGGAGIWWGENLAGAKAQPVKLSNPHKLVYSPHCAPPLAQQPCAHALSENHKHP
jgi:aryl-phospho-beta-D-glucosidase BglC (GH1 family)